MHTLRNQKKLVARVRRVRGQIEAVERALLAGKECEDVLRTVAAARGAINALAAEILCDHVEAHVGAAGIPQKQREAAALELARVLRQFIT